MTDTLQPCDTCDGTGFHSVLHKDGPSEDCPSCLGVGRVPTETVIERVAEAIADFTARAGWTEYWKDQTDSERESWRLQARAAVQAYLKETQNAQTTNR